MKVSYHKKILKELALIPQPSRIGIEHFVFDELPLLNNFIEIKGVEKMTGYKGYFKIRFGDYRLGFYFGGDGIILERILHRKEIYRYYP